MKKFFIWLFRLLCWITIAGYLFSSFSTHFTPSRYFFSDVLGLAYPFALIGLVIVIVVTAVVNRKIAVVALLCLFVGYNNLRRSFAFHPFARHELSHTDTNSLRVLTWNVYFFQNDHWLKNDNQPNLPRKQMIEAIRQLNPDILCFQEYLSYNKTGWNVSMNEVFAQMGYKYRLFSNDKIYKVGAGYSEIGTVIFSRLPVIDSNRVFLHNHMEEYLESMDVLFKQKPVRIFATHLASLGLYTDTAHTGLGNENIYELTYSRKRMVVRKLRVTGIEHEKESAIIRRAIDQSPYPAVFCADMNSAPCTYAYRIIRGNMQDAFLEKGFGFGQTYDAISPTLRIDVCFADKRLAVKDCFVQPLHGLSDHFPVVTTLQWK